MFPKHFQINNFLHQRCYFVQFKQEIEQLTRMYHPPVARKVPKKFTEEERPSSIDNVRPNFIQRSKEIQSKKKLTEKHINQPILPKIPSKANNKTIPQKVEMLEKVVEKMSLGNNPPQMQRLLLQEIQGIKSELREIKQQIGLSPGQNNKTNNYQQLASHQTEENQQEQNIANLAPRQYHEVRSEHPQQRSNIRVETSPPPTHHFQQQHNQQYHIENKKQLLDIGKIQPYMKDFKLQGTKIPQPIYRGYYKKNSKPVVIKYCKEDQTMENQICIYQRLWKNIVKAKKVCINRIYDINDPLAHNIMALEMNKCELKDIQLPPEQILKEVLRAIQFMHECGYLFRDLHPDHVMQTFEGNIVLVGLKLMKRYTDIKSKILEVKGNPNEEGIHQFVSNARLRGVSESRKDDIETIGYLALYLLEGKLPWSINNMIQVRSKVTLQQLYGRYKGLFQFMVTVHKMANDQQPNYDFLYSLISL